MQSETKFYLDRTSRVCHTSYKQNRFILFLCYLLNGTVAALLFLVPISSLLSTTSRKYLTGAVNSVNSWRVAKWVYYFLARLPDLGVPWIRSSPFALLLFPEYTWNSHRLLCLGWLTCLESVLPCAHDRSTINTCLAFRRTTRTEHRPQTASSQTSHQYYDTYTICSLVLWMIKGDNSIVGSTRADQKWPHDQPTIYTQHNLNLTFSFDLILKLLVRAIFFKKHGLLLSGACGRYFLSSCCSCCIGST